MKRIFIGLKVEQGEILKEIIAEMKTMLGSVQVKWIEPGNIHITLAFPGNTDESLITPVISMLNEKTTGSGKFVLTLKGAGVFRSFSDPRILWTGIEQSDKLKNLNETIVHGLTNIGIKLEDRPFNPHLTLGRIKHLNDKEILKSLVEKYKNTIIQTVPVNEVILFESILHSSGPEYKPLAKICL
jgi:RNA 2',3'-cyclic 3'-phosphodiesterase